MANYYIQVKTKDPCTNITYDYFISEIIRFGHYPACRYCDTKETAKIMKTLGEARRQANSILTRKTHRGDMEIITAKVLN